MSMRAKQIMNSNQKLYVRTNLEDADKSADVAHQDRYKSPSSGKEKSIQSNDPTDLYLWALLAFFIPLIGCIALIFYGKSILFF